jgi:hypothetical protein
LTKPDDDQHAGPDHRSLIATAGAWLEQIDPGAHHRIKGLRLVTTYGIAAMLGPLPAISHGLPGGASLSSLVGGIALWASDSEAQTTRAASSRDLTLLCAAAVFGAVSMIILTPLLSGAGRPGPELTLAVGAFLVGYLRRFGFSARTRRKAWPQAYLLTNGGACPQVRDRKGRDSMTGLGCPT